MKQKKKGKIALSFTSPEKENYLPIIYDVITWKKSINGSEHTTYKCISVCNRDGNVHAQFARNEQIARDEEEVRRYKELLHHREQAREKEEALRKAKLAAMEKVAQVCSSPLSPLLALSLTLSLTVSRSRSLSSPPPSPTSLSLSAFLSASLYSRLHLFPSPFLSLSRERSLYTSLLFVHDECVLA
jgi:hypothetical protein